LFWFAGGWVRYELPSTHGMLAVALGGIVVETLIGLMLWIAFARRVNLAGRIVRAVGAALIIHAGWYLATGTWHGYGDGVQLHHELGDAKWLVAIPAAIVTCAFAYLGARGILGDLAASVPGSRGARIGAMILAVALAGSVQAGAAIGEVKLRRDAVYGAIMKPAREREIAAELAQWRAEQARRGLVPSEEARAAQEAELERAHRTFPFAVVLGLATVLAIGLGAARSRVASPGGLTPRLLAIAAMIAGGSIAAVIAIGAAFA
jgi:hypothetical protein